MSDVRVRLPLGACSRSEQRREGKKQRGEKDTSDTRPPVVRLSSVSFPLSTLYPGVWESLEIRLPWAQEIVSSNLTMPICRRQIERRGEKVESRKDRSRHSLASCPTLLSLLSTFSS